MLLPTISFLFFQILKPGEESKAMLEALRSDPRAARQFVLLAHLYSRTDSASLAQIRRALLAPRYTPAQVISCWGAFASC
jgi:Tfp pilus assembly protein PilF